MRGPPQETYRPVAAPWAAGGARAARAVSALSVPPPTAARATDTNGEPSASPSFACTDAASFESLARECAECSAPVDCELLHVLRVCASASPPLLRGVLSAGCTSAAFELLLRPWEEAAAAERAAAAGVAHAVSPSQLDSWLEAAYGCLGALTRCPAFAPAELPPRWCGALFVRLASARTRPSEVPHLRALLHWAYRTQTGARRALRRRLGALLGAAGAPGAAWPPAPGLCAALEVLWCVICGLERRPPLRAHHAQLLALLLPLFRVSGFLPHQHPPVSALQPLCAPLVRCVCRLLHRSPGWATLAVEGVAAGWPASAAQASAPKCELLLGALQAVLCSVAASPQHAAEALASALPLFSLALRDEHAGVAAGAATACAAAAQAARASPQAPLRALLPPLIADAAPHWSGEVNAARHAALIALQALDPTLFHVIATECLAAAAAAAAAASPSRPPARAPSPSLAHLLHRLAPPEQPPSAACLSEAMSLSHAPLLLPEAVGFNDLIFGATLGSGSFSTVTAARVRARGVPASSWREVAVKRLCHATLAGRRYSRAIAREISALRLVHHPGCARLVAAFRYRRDVFLLLEHAPGGDLHSRVSALGSLSPASVRFLAAQLLAALHAVHAAGLAFGDLKPENVVLTASGHAKLTDFGAARALPGSAAGTAATGRTAALAVLVELRSGDWRAQSGLPARRGEPAAGDSHLEEEEEEEDEDEEDERLEGTPAYLSPELLAGGLPSVASDAWALGCLVFQCLTGRLPLWSDDPQALLQRIAAWTGCPASLFPASLPGDAVHFCTRLLEPEPARRLGGCEEGLRECMRHAWLEGLQCDQLHAATPPPLARGAAGAAAPGAHVPRQNSVLWSRLPGCGGTSLGAEGRSEQGVAATIEETEGEAGAPWTAVEQVAAEQVGLVGAPSTSKLRPPSGKLAPTALASLNECE